MKTNLLKNYFMRRAEEIAPSSEIKLWPQIQSQISSHGSVLPQSNGGFKMKRSYAVLITIGLALMLAVGFFAFTPTGKTLAQQFISLFNKAPDSRPFDPDNGPPSITPIANLADGEAMTGWHIYQPSWLPDGVVPFETEYRPVTDRVSQSFGFQKVIGMTSSYFFIGQRKSSFNELWPVGESSLVETVKIGDVTGEYVIGAWGGAKDHLEWEAIPNFQHLRWQKDGVYFDLEYSMFGVEPKDIYTNPYYMTKDQLIAIAASMK